MKKKLPKVVLYSFLVQGSSFQNELHSLWAILWAMLFLSLFNKLYNFFVLAIFLNIFFFFWLIKLLVITFSAVLDFKKQLLLQIHFFFFLFLSEDTKTAIQKLPHKINLKYISEKYVWHDSWRLISDGRF